MYDYNLSVKGKSLFKTFDIDNEKVIGVKQGEQFSVIFENNTPDKIQVRLSIDGTDILTGEFASTKPSGKMWVVEANSKLELSAWPEDNNGGASFIFTTKDKSVALNTHGNNFHIGLIRAAIYTEAHTYNLPYAYKFGSINRNFLTPDTYNLPCGYASIAVEDIAVGAGDRVEQNLTEATGLIKPVLEDVIQIRYLPWKQLEKTLSKKDKSKKHIDLTNVPRIKKVAKSDMSDSARFI